MSDKFKRGRTGTERFFKKHSGFKAHRDRKWGFKSRRLRDDRDPDQARY